MSSPIAPRVPPLILIAFLLNNSPSTGAQPAGEFAPGPRVFRGLAYVSDGHDRQKLDLYLPSEGIDWPLVVWVHGGAWRAGSKDRCPAEPLVDRGYAVASLNYRLSQHALFPAQIEDCKAAIRWLRANAGSFGYDPANIGVWGGSAGGHLVALLGTAGDTVEFDVGEHLNHSSAVQAAVDFYGPTDFSKMNEQAGPEGRLDHDAPNSPEAQLLGGPVQQNVEAVTRANPIRYISIEDPPFLIVHGELDFTVPLGQSRLLDSALRRSGLDSRLEVVPGGGHGMGNLGLDRESILATVGDFFDEQLKPAPNEHRFVPVPTPAGLRHARFRLWLPDSVSQGVGVRGVIGVSDYHAGKRIFFDPRWRALAARQRFALLLHLMTRPVAERSLAKDEPGIAAIEQALVALGERTGHPELGTVGLVFTGLSQSGHQACAFAGLRPERTIAAIAYHGSSARRDPGGAVGPGIVVPQLHVIAENDALLPAQEAHEYVLRGRGKGALWASVFQRREVHHLLGDPSFMLEWLQSVIDLRVTFGASGSPRPLTEDRGWLGALPLLDGRLPDGAEMAVASAAGYVEIGAEAAAMWLPSERIAAMWRAYCLKPDARDLSAAPEVNPRAGGVESVIFKQTPHENLSMTIHYPPGWTAADRRPAVVFFFGGGWRKGTVKQFAPQAAYFAEQGLVTARADYRVRERHSVYPDACVEDAKSAVRWLRRNAGILGIDSDRIAASGGSAGGHLAAATATVTGFDAVGEDLETSARPDLLILFNPVMDTLVVADRMPSMAVARQLSPVHQLRFDGVPSIHFFGSDDWLINTSIDFLDRANALGVSCDLLVADGQRHGFFNSDPWFTETMWWTHRFLNRHGYLITQPKPQRPREEHRMRKLKQIRSTKFKIRNEDRWQEVID